MQYQTENWWTLLTRILELEQYMPSLFPEEDSSIVLAPVNNGNQTRIDLTIAALT